MASGKQRARSRRVREEKSAAEPNIRDRSAKELNCMKKTGLIIAAICILLVLAGAIAFANRPTPEGEMMDMLNRVENALGDEWKKQTVTKSF